MSQFNNNNNKLMRWFLQLPADIITSHIIVQATDNCHYNKCNFCYTYKDEAYDEGYPPFRILPLEEIKRDFIETYNKYSPLMMPYHPNIKKAFICDADPLVMPTKDFIAILEFLKTYEPIKQSLNTIATYARADTLLKKQENLQEIHDTGLTDIYMGVESGDDRILNEIHKGYDVNTIRTAAHKVQIAKYATHVFVITGIGGQERTKEHAEMTASLLNDINPFSIILSPLTISALTPLGQKYKNNQFQDLTLEQKIKEETRLITNLTCTSEIKLMGCFRCSNIGIQGHLPKDKDKILSWLENKAFQSQHYQSCAPMPIGQGIFTL